MTLKEISFQKKTRNKIPLIPGTKLSLQNAQLLVSSGVPSLDHVIGGGVPVGTILLVEEDIYGSYANILLKFFLAEGVVSGHSLFISSLDKSPLKIAQDLPVAVESDKLDSLNASQDEKMAIAWRYQNMKIVQSAPASTTFGHHFDLTKTIDKEEVLSKSDVHYWNGSNNSRENSDLKNSTFNELIDKIRDTAKDGGFNVMENAENKNVLRVAIDSLGSPLWSTDGQAERSLKARSDMASFFYKLRGLLRSAYAVCMVTVPSHLFQDPALILRCQHLSDTCLRLESFAGSAKETHPSFKDYHGLFHVTKLSAINTITCHIPESSDLAFKLRRKKFLIELSGLALVGLGACLLIDVPRVLLSRLFAPSTSHPLFYYMSLCFIAVGLLICALGVLGCWAAYLHNRCLLAIYLFALIVLLLGESVVVVLAVLCPQYLGIGLGSPLLVELLQRNYGVPGKEQLTSAFDLAQTYFECCGINGAADYDFSWWRLKELGQPELVVPRSCCVLSNSNDDRAFLDPHPVNTTKCQSIDQESWLGSRHREGCSVKLESWYRDHTWLFLAIGLGLILVELSVLLSAIIACIRVPAHYPDYTSHYIGTKKT